MSKLKIFNKLLQKVGFEVYKYSPRVNHAFRRAKLIRHLGIEVVLDVGANIGAYGLEIREYGFDGRIISFEPIKIAYEKLRQKAIIDTNWDVYNIALGMDNTKSVINISENIFSSSFLKIEQKHLDAAISSRYVRNEECEMRTLKSVFEDLDLTGEKIFLKIDTQGFEDQVLKGADNVLQKIAAIQLELSIQPLYKEQSLFHELYTFLRAKGFYLHDVSPGFMNEATGEMLQFDGIFRQMNK